MSAIEWNEGFHIGVAEIDAQHEKLVSMANELYYAFMSGEDNAVLSEIVTGMSDYSVYHFGTEEALMRDHGYPQSEGHLAQHKEFTNKTLDFLLTYVSGEDQGLTIEVLDYLMDWWVRHIKGTDMAFGRFLQSKSVA